VGTLILELHAHAASNNSNASSNSSSSSSSSSSGGTSAARGPTLLRGALKQELDVEVVVLRCNDLAKAVRDSIFETILYNFFSLFLPLHVFDSQLYYGFKMTFS
jgi:hypothetical protein